MALTVRKTDSAMIRATAVAFNAFVRAFVSSETTFPHYDITSTPTGDYTAPGSTPLTIVPTSTADLAHVITLAEAERSFLLVHFADTVAHGVADDVSLALIDYDAVAKLTSASSQGETDTLLNALSTALTAHLTRASVHPTNDSTTVITATGAIDLASSKLLAADLRVQALAHILLAWGSPSLNLVPA